MLILLRHGRTASNASGLLLGRSDPPLDPLGERQAVAAAARIRATHDPVRVVCSPLARTRATAAALGLPMAIDEQWIELDYGELDGTPLADVDPEMWHRWTSDVDFRPPGGETTAELGARVRRGCEELAAEAAEHDIVVVTHVSPVKAATAWALGVDDTTAWRMFVAPASITTIACARSRPSLHGFNAVEHLTGLK